MLCENIFFDGSGTIYIIEPNKNDIAIDKFCSCESRTPLEGQFAYFNGDINSTILQGSIVNGGNSSVSNGMISNYFGSESISETNISNCISRGCTAFQLLLRYHKSITKVSFCNFESLIATHARVNAFYHTPVLFERCNYINNSQSGVYSNGIFTAVGNYNFNILDSVFKNNKMKYLFEAVQDAKIYVIRSYIYDANVPNTGSVYTSEKETDLFNNDLKFIGLKPCEGDIIVVFVRAKEEKICSMHYPEYFHLYKYHLTIMLMNTM